MTTDLLKALRLQPIGPSVFGASGRTQVVKVRKSDCTRCQNKEDFQCRLCGSPFAAKIIPPREKSLIGIDAMLLTKLLLTPIDDTAVVYHERLWKEGFIVLLMDIHQSTLRHLINGCNRLTEGDWMIIMFGLFTRLANAARLNLIHGDLKPSNVLINLTDNCTLRRDDIHISDFGLVYHSSQNGSVVGTFPYVAPEILLQSNSAATLSSDMWAAGCIGYELCTGQQLPHTLRCSLDNLDDLKEYADCIDLVAIVEQGFGSLTVDIIGRCLTWYPSNRPTAAQMKDEIGRIVSSSGYRETRSLTLSSTDNENVGLEEPAVENRDEDSNRLGAEMNPIMEILYDRNELEKEDFDWTTGGSSTLRHREVIDKGASGEVHALFDCLTGQIFARKLIRPFGEITAQHIWSELRAVCTLCGPDKHENLVSVLKFGRMRRTMYCFIDMERCDLNLETYILRKWTTMLEQTVPFFTTIDSSSSGEKIRQIGQLMKDIGQGVAYIHLHKMVHRDLKPRNILYSRQQGVWKIGDFGLTMEGTSQKHHTTRYARGTSSYRAPELLISQTFTNKVDIWALGCVLYEVVTRKKAFQNDHEVLALLHYNSSGEHPRMLFDMGDYQDKSFRSSVVELVHSMLNFDPTMRPSAVQLMDSMMLTFR